MIPCIFCSVYINQSDLDATILCSVEPQVMVIIAPQNTSVTEGNNTNFTCMVENSSGSPLTIGWRFTPNGSSSEEPMVNGTNLTGIEMVTVSGWPRTTLTFSGVQRQANGGKVVCLADGYMSPPALLTVQCEFDHIPLFRHTYHHFTCSGAVMLAQEERVCFSFA